MTPGEAPLIHTTTPPSGPLMYFLIPPSNMPASIIIDVSTAEPSEAPSILPDDTLSVQKEGDDLTDAIVERRHRRTSLTRSRDMECRIGEPPSPSLGLPRNI